MKKHKILSFDSQTLTIDATPREWTVTASSQLILRSRVEDFKVNLDALNIASIPSVT